MDTQAVVTGAGGFLGRVIAAELAARGHRLALVDIDARALDAVARDIGDQATRYSLDITDEAAVARFAAESTAAHGPWQVLVNNAGITRDRSIANLELRDWNAVLAVNLTAPFLLIRELIRRLRDGRQPDWGRVINISSLSGSNGNFGQGNYAASKSGLEALTRVAARELAQFGYTANAVAPGFIDSPMTSIVPRDVRETRVAQIPLGRPGAASDIAATVGFLASPGSAYLTGAVLPVNGGLKM